MARTRGFDALVFPPIEALGYLARKLQPETASGGIGQNKHYEERPNANFRFDPMLLSGLVQQRRRRPVAGFPHDFDLTPRERFPDRLSGESREYGDQTAGAAEGDSAGDPIAAPNFFPPI